MTKLTRSQQSATAWCRQPASSRNRRASGLVGTMPWPTSLLTSRTVAGQGGQRGQQGLGFGGQRVVAGGQQVAEPQSQAIHQQATVWGGVGAQGGGQCHRFLDQPPVVGTRGAVTGDALDHFCVAGLGGGEIDHVQTAGGGPALSKDALAGAGTAENEFFHVNEPAMAQSLE